MMQVRNGVIYVLFQCKALALESVRLTWRVFSQETALVTTDPTRETNLCKFPQPTTAARLQCKADLRRLYARRAISVS